MLGAAVGGRRPQPSQPRPRPRPWPPNDNTGPGLPSRRCVCRDGSLPASAGFAMSASGRSRSSTRRTCAAAAGRTVPGWYQAGQAPAWHLRLGPCARPDRRRMRMELQRLDVMWLSRPAASDRGACLSAHLVAQPGPGPGPRHRGLDDGERVPSGGLAGAGGDLFAIDGGNYRVVRRSRVMPGRSSRHG